MSSLDGMGLGQLAQHFRETEPWASDPPDVRKYMIMAIRAERDGDTAKADEHLDKAIAASA